MAAQQTVDAFENMPIEELQRLRTAADDALEIKKAEEDLAAAEKKLARLKLEAATKAQGIFYSLVVFVVVHHLRVFNYILFVNFVLPFMNNSLICFLYLTNYCFSGKCLGLLNVFDNLAIALFSNFVN